MNREQPFDRLQFDEDAILNDNVEAIAAFHKEVLVLNGQRVLADEPKTSQPEFGTETRLVRRFEEPRAQAAMDLDERSDDRVGAVFKSPDLPISLFHLRASAIARRKLPAEMRGCIRCVTRRSKTFPFPIDACSLHRHG